MTWKERIAEGLAQNTEAFVEANVNSEMPPDRRVLTTMITGHRGEVLVVAAGFTPEGVPAVTVRSFNADGTPMSPLVFDLDNTVLVTA